MDKNNDIKVNEVSKWDAAPESIKNAYEYVNALYDPLPDERNPIIDALSKVLDDYNELEAKYQKQCGLISEYEEERQKDGELAKHVGNHIVECIKYGAEHGYYELHPHNRFDIHIEEMRVTPMQDRHTIPRIVVQCNNVQTEMERDTAQHELEELQERYDELKKKYEFQKKKNIELASKNKALGMEISERCKQIHELKDTLDRTTLALCERDASTARNLCHSIAFNMVEFHKGEVKKEEENCQGLNKIITRKNAEMCNLKWERDETEKKIKILIDELKKQYDINVTFYQKPGIDMHGLKNFGVHIDCEENRKAFNDLKEALDKYKTKNENLITDTKRLSNAVEAWINMFNDMRHKRDFLKKENDALKKKLNAIYGYHDTDNPCGICKNFDPKE